MSRDVAQILMAAATGMVATTASGQTYPIKPIRVITAAAGASSDFTARLVAHGISASVGQPVIVDNRAGGVIPGAVVSQAAADGYTLLISANSLWIGALLQKTPYDPVRDFLPVSVVLSQPNILVVHPALPVNSVKDLIALAKARPGELNYSSSGSAGGSTQLAAELLKSMAGVNIVNIPYKGSAPGLADLMSGQVQLSFGTSSTVGPHIRSGRLKALAVTSAAPSSLFPSLSTVAASGLPGYQADNMTGLFTPARVAAVIVKRLHEEVAQLVRKTDVKEKILGSGAEPVGNSPDEFAAAIRAEMTRWGKVIKEAGIRAD